MREFKEGDLVESPRYGKGIVVEVVDHFKYPVYVEFSKSNHAQHYSDRIQQYTKDGRWSNTDLSPSLSHVEAPEKQELYITNFLKGFSWQNYVMMFWAIVLMGYGYLPLIIPIFVMLALIVLSFALVELAINHTKPSKEK